MLISSFIFQLIFCGIFSIIISYIEKDSLKGFILRWATTFLISLIFYRLTGGK